MVPAFIPLHDCQVEELAELADATLESLACVMVDRCFQPGEVLMYQGQDMEDMFIISQGTVKVGRLRSLDQLMSCPLRN